MRNPLSWRNVNTTVSSNPNLALKVFQDSNNSLLGTFKAIYDRKREANTIDAMEKIRAGEPIGTDYNGIVDRKALLDFSIKQEQLRRQERLDNAQLDRLNQIMSLAIAEENRKKQTFPISIEAARLQNKRTKFENSNLKNTYNLNKKLTESRINLNKAKAIDTKRTNSLESIKVKAAKSNYNNQIEIENLRDEYVATQQAISNALKDNNYEEVKRLTDEANILKQEIGAKSGSIKGLEPTKGETTNLYNIGFNSYINTFKDVPLTDEEKLAIASKSKKVMNKSDFLKKQIGDTKGSLRKNRELRYKKNIDKYYRNYLLDEVNNGHIKAPDTKSVRREPTDEDFLRQGINIYDPTIKASVYRGLTDAKNKSIKEGIDRIVKISKELKDNQKRAIKVKEAIKSLAKKYDTTIQEIEVELLKKGVRL